MNWDTSVMTGLIDIVMILVSGYLVYLLMRDHQTDERPEFSVPVALLLVGVILITLFYFFDLISVFFSPPDKALSGVARHPPMNWHWIAILASLSFMVFGFTRFINKLNPKIVKDYPWSDPANSSDYYTVAVSEVIPQGQMEEILRREDNRLREAQKIARMGFFERDILANKIYWSDEVVNIFGRTPEEFSQSSDPIMDFIHPDDRQAFKHERDKAIRTGQRLNHEYRIVTKSGEVRHIFSLVNLIRNEQDEIHRAFGIIIDITERKVVEEELRRYNNIANSSMDLMVFVDSNYIYKAVNQRYLDAVNREREQVMERPVCEVLGEEKFRKFVKKDIDRCLQGEGFRLCKWFDFPGLGRRYLEFSHTPHWEADGKITGAVITGHDITEQKLAEDALQNRINQQAVIAELGRQTLKSHRPEDLMNYVVKRVAETLSVEHCKVFEFSPSKKELRLAAAMGGDTALVGKMMIPFDARSQAGYTLLVNEPVIVEDLTLDKRFSDPRIMDQDNLISSASVIIHGQKVPWGILIVYACEKKAFNKDDINFLQAVANIFTEVLEYKYSELTLRQSEEKFRGLLESAQDGIVIVNCHGEIELVNEKLQIMTQYCSDELLEQPIEKLLPDRFAGNHQGLRRNFFQAPHTRQMGENLELFIRRKDGKEIPVEINLNPLVTEQGMIVSAVVRDITDRKNSERELQRYRHIVDTTADLMAYLDSDYVYRAINQSYLDLFKKDASEVIGHTPVDVIGMDTFYNDVKPDLDRCLSGENIHTLKWLLTPDNHRICLDINFNPYKEHDGTVSGVVFSARDVTQAKLAEQELRQYKHIVDSTNEAMILVDKDYIYRAANKSYLDYYLKSWGEVVGHDVIAVIGEEAFRTHAKHNIDRCLQGESVTNYVWRDYPATKGVQLYMAVSFSPYIDENGKIAGAVLSIRDTSERKIVEDELQIYKHIINATRDSMAFIDTDLIYRAVNQQFIDTFRLPREKIVGKSIVDIIGVEYFETSAKKKLISCLDGEVVNYQIKRMRDGSYKYLDVNLSPFYNEKGVITGIVSSVRDIDGIKHAEKELKRYKHIVDASNEIMAFVDVDYIFRTVNNTFLHMMNVKPEEVVGRHVSEVIGRERFEKNKRKYYGKVFAGDTQKQNSWFPFPDIGERYLEVTYIPHRDEDNTITGMVMTLRDMTEHKLTQEGLARAKRDNELILEAAGEGIYGVNTDGCITFINPTAAQMLGYEADKLIGSRQHELIHHSRADGSPYPRTECPIYAAFNDGNVHYVSDEVFWRQDGSSFPVDYVSTPIQQDGEYIGAVVVFRDITEQKKAEEELKLHRENLQTLVDQQTANLVEAKHEAERANEAKSEFLANMSHELRTPMHAILHLANTTMKRIETNSPEKTLKSLTRIEQSGKRLLDLINDLLDLSKLEANKVIYNFQEIELTEILALVVDELSSLMYRKNIKLNININDVPTAAIGDKRAISQVLVNLLSNAIKFTPDEKFINVEFFKSELSAKDSGNVIPAVTVSIIDQGVGIPKGELETVFDKFVQSSKTKTGAGGTGLGLAICKEIITHNNGRIWAENNPEGGAIFNFNLPLAA